jgi:hypothetical protein
MNSNLLPAGTRVRVSYGLHNEHEFDGTVVLDRHGDRVLVHYDIGRDIWVLRSKLEIIGSDESAA